jgi:hypothetical protein
MNNLPQFQTYATYRDFFGGKRHWLPIGSSETEALIARIQLKRAGKVNVRVRNGRPQGPVRIRPRRPY